MDFTYLDADGMKFLAGIDPYSEIIDKLNDIIANNNFKRENQPSLVIKNTSSDESGSASESVWNMPKLRVTLLEQSASERNIVFQVCIVLYNCDHTRNGKSALVCMLTSRFKECFTADNFAQYYAVLSMDVTTAARFITYYMKVFGYEESSDYRIGMNMWFTSGGKSELNLSEDVTVPEPLRRAVSKLKELHLVYDDWIFVRLSGPGDRETNKSMIIQSYTDEDGSIILDFSNYVTDRTEIEKIRSYRNFDYLDVWAERDGYVVGLIEDDSEESLRFITDYFLFQNPNISNDGIVASLDFNYCSYYDQEEANEGDDDTSDLLYSFYPDGSEDAQEKLARFLDEVKNRHRYYEEKCEEENQTQVHGLTPYGEDLDYKAFRKAESSEAVRYIYNDLGWYHIEYGGRKARFSDESGKLVMEISRQDLSRIYCLSSNVVAVCTFYLSQEQKDEFYKLYSDPRIGTYEYEAEDDKEPAVTVCLPDDVELVSKYVAYCLISVGYDPKRLSCELKVCPAIQA